MTVLGKILVFINLIFSLLVGGLVLMVYMARTNYADALKTSEQSVKVLDAKLQTQTEQLELAQKQHDKALAAKAGELNDVQQNLKAQVDENNSLAEKLRQEKAKSVASAASAQTAQANASLRQADVAQMRGILDAERKKNDDLVILNTKLRDQATQSTLKAQTLQDRLKRTEKLLQDATRQLVRIKANTGNQAETPVAKNGKNPPPENIRGIVLNYDAEANLAKLSIGSDSGLKNGHTMEIYRFTPGRPLYLGTLRIIDVSEKAAVAEPLGKLNDTPRHDDRVASRLF